MIADQNRADWFGASDTDYIVGNWKTKTFTQWWLKKIGIDSSRHDNRYTLAGTHWEHRILESLDLPDLTMDKQILLPELCLRVNLDGNTPDCIHEVKTYQWEKGFRVPLKYWRQVQVQMYASGIHRAEINAYGLQDADYDNYLRELDSERLSTHPILWDPDWVESQYLPKLRTLAQCLKDGRIPDEAQI